MMTCSHLGSHQAARWLQCGLGTCVVSNQLCFELDMSSHGRENACKEAVDSVSWATCRAGGEGFMKPGVTAIQKRRKLKVGQGGDW